MFLYLVVNLVLALHEHNDNFIIATEIKGGNAAVHICITMELMDAPGKLCFIPKYTLVKLIENLSHHVSYAIN